MEPQRGPGQGRGVRRGQRGPRRPSRAAGGGKGLPGRRGEGQGPGAFLLWERPSRGQVPVIYPLGAGALEAAGPQPCPGGGALGSDGRWW